MSVSADRIVSLAGSISSIRKSIEAGKAAIERLDKDCASGISNIITVHVGNASASFEKDSWVVLAFRRSLEARITRGEARLARIEQSLKEVGHG